MERAGRERQKNQLQSLIALNLLVDWVDILGRFYLCRGNKNDSFVVRLVLFHDRKGDRSVITMAPAGAVRHDCEDPEHADEDTNTAADNKGDSPTLPVTEIHEGVVQSRQEGAVMLVKMSVFLMLKFIAWVTMSHTTNPVVVGERKNANQAVFFVLVLFVVRRLTMVVVVVVVTMVLDFNQRPAERLSEAVANLDRLYLDPVHDNSSTAFFATTAWAMTETLERDEVGIGRNRETLYRRNR